MSPIASLCVFCGSRTGNDPVFEAAARGLAREMLDRGVRLIYGGGGIGLMGILAETIMAGGGQVTGVIPDFLLKYEVGKPDVTELVIVGSMHDRKNRMFEMADGFVALPGGLGTLDETMEIITWKQLRLHDKPIVVADVGGYWQPLRSLIDGVIGGGFAHPAAAELFTVVDDVSDIFPALQAAPIPKEEVLTSHF